MKNTIVIDLGEMITCPKDQHVFALREGITQQVIEGYARKYDEQFAAEKERMEREATLSAERQLKKLYDAKLAEQAEAMKEKEDDLARFKQRAKQERDKAVAEALSEKTDELSELKKTLLQKDEKVKALQQQERSLRDEKSKLEARAEELDLEVSQKVDAERVKLRLEADRRMAESIQLKLAERDEESRRKQEDLQRKLEVALRDSDALRRKLEQGSQQSQGEVLEEDLEARLRRAFPLDELLEVKKGARGADLLQRVHNRRGQCVGVIVWEAKRTANWSDAWVGKLKDDCTGCGGTLAVLVSSAMPKGWDRPFGEHEGLWLARPEVVEPVALMLRCMLERVFDVYTAGQGKGEKAEILYDYLTTGPFKTHMKRVVDTFNIMKRQLQAEQQAMNTLWSKRSKQIDQAILELCYINGEMQAIDGEGMHGLDSVFPLMIEGEEDEPTQG